MYALRQWLKWLSQLLERTASAFIVYTSALHCFWTLAIFFDPLAAQHPAVIGLHGILSPFMIAVVVGISALLSFVGILRRRLTSFQRLLCLLPQQAIMVLSGVVVVQAILSGVYLTGGLYSSWFIAADKMHWLLTTFFHTYAVWETGRIPGLLGYKEKEELRG